jgi:hypothetical protein
MACSHMSWIRQMPSAKELEELGFSNECSDMRGGWRRAGLSCDKVTALASGRESDLTQITVRALSLEHLYCFNGGDHR